MFVQASVWAPFSRGVELHARGAARGSAPRARPCTSGRGGSGQGPRHPLRPVMQGGMIPVAYTIGTTSSRGHASPASDRALGELVSRSRTAGSACCSVPRPSSVALRRRYRAESKTSSSPLRATSAMGRNRELAKVGCAWARRTPSTASGGRGVAGQAGRSSTRPSSCGRPTRWPPRSVDEGRAHEDRPDGQLPGRRLPEPIATRWPSCRPRRRRCRPSSAATSSRRAGRAADDSSPSGTTKPIAAASIGQVHRAIDARRPRGRGQGAVPGRRRGDPRRPRQHRTCCSASLGKVIPGLDPKPIVGEIREPLIEELDYRERGDEPDRVRRALRRPSVHPHPAVIDEYCDGSGADVRARSGARFAEVVETWSQEARDLAAETIYRFVFRGSTGSAVQRRPAPGQLPVRPTAA